MAGFVDATMVRLSDPAHLRDLVAPPGEAGQERIRRLLATVYALPDATIHQVTRVDVLTSEFQRPLFPARRLAGTWTQTTPSHTRTDVLYEGSDGLAAEWLDLAARLAVTLVLRVDPGEVESIRLAEPAEFSTLAEFEAQFRAFDLAAFMAEHGLSTVEDLKRAYRYLLGGIRLRDPGPFDPADPAHQRRFDLPLAIFIRDEIDLSACLRAVRLAREAGERALPYQRHTGDGEVLGPFATLLVLPAAAVVADGFTEAELTAFFAAQDAVVVFANEGGT